MRCLNEGFAITVMIRSSRSPRQFLSRSYRAVHSDMTLFSITHNSLTAQGLLLQGMSG
jgi:hypothetical protein